MGQSYIANFDGNFGEPIYVFHPHGRVREALAAVFEMELIPYRTFWNPDHFISFFGHQPSRFVVAPMWFEGRSGLDLAQVVLDRRRGLLAVRDTKMILVGRYSAKYTRMAIKMGVYRVMPAPLNVDQLLQIYRTESSGAREMFAENSLGKLTEREAEITDLIVRGETHKQIARRLGISPRTVSAHAQRIRRKLNAYTAFNLVWRVTTG